MDICVFSCVFVCKSSSFSSHLEGSGLDASGPTRASVVVVSALVIGRSSAPAAPPAGGRGCSMFGIVVMGGRGHLGSAPLQQQEGADDGSRSDLHYPPGPSIHDASVWLFTVDPTPLHLPEKRKRMHLSCAGRAGL